MKEDVVLDVGFVVDAPAEVDPPLPPAGSLLTKLEVDTVEAGWRLLERFLELWPDIVPTLPFSIASELAPAVHAYERAEWNMCEGSGYER